MSEDRKSLAPWLRHMLGGAFAPRLCVYSLASMGVLAGLCQLIIKGERGRSILYENSVVEWAQVFVLLTMAVVLWSRHDRSLCRVLSGLALVAVFREWDALSERNFFDDAYKLPLFTGLLVLVLYSYRQRRVLEQELYGFIRRPGLVLMLMGLLVALGWAQAIGQRELWQTVVDSKFVRWPKRMAEEGLELMGYFLMLCGAIEERVFAPRDTPSDAPP